MPVVRFLLNPGIGRSTQVQEKECGNITLQGLPGGVQPRGRRHPGVQINPSRHRRVQVYHLAIFQPLDQTEHFRPQLLELTLNVWNDFAIAGERTLKEATPVAGQRDFVEFAPAGAVVLDQEIPLVIDIVDTHNGMPAAQLLLFGLFLSGFVLLGVQRIQGRPMDGSGPGLANLFLFLMLAQRQKNSLQDGLLSLGQLGLARPLHHRVRCAGHAIFVLLLP